MMYLILVGVLLVSIVLWLISRYNTLVHARSLVHEAESGIDVQLKRRYDLIPNLLDTVKGYSFHEKSIIEDIVKGRVASMSATGIHQKEQAEQGLTQSLKTLFALSEQYPNLKANENFLSLQKELSSIEQEIQLSRRYYNGTVRGYMVHIYRFPTSLIASLFSFQPISYFEIDKQERDVPRTKF